MTFRLKAFLGESPNANLDFRRNRLYDRARKAAREVGRCAGHWPQEEREALTVPVKRSSRTVAAALARAFSSRKPEAEFVGHLAAATASCRETQAWLDQAFDAGCLSPEYFVELNVAWERLAKDLDALLEKSE